MEGRVLGQEEQSLEMKQQQQVAEEEKNFHVLAVDDSLIDRKLLEKLLKISSFQVTCVESGDKALEYLGLVDYFSSEKESAKASLPTTKQVVNVNMIMTDFCMPGMTGYDLLKRVKGSAWKDVPVVVMSSENIPSRIHMCLKEGAEDFILKPLRLSDMEKLQSLILKSLTTSCIRKPPDNNNEDVLLCCDVYGSLGSSSSSTGKRKSSILKPPPQLLEIKRLKTKDE